MAESQIRYIDLIRSGPFVPSDYFGYACDQGYLNQVKLLIRSTPGEMVINGLKIAIRKGHLPIVCFLSSFNNSSENLVLASKTGYTNVFQYLRSKMNVSSGMLSRCLMGAFNTPNVNLILQLISEDVKLHREYQSYAERLILSVVFLRLDIIKWVIKNTQYLNHRIMIQAIKTSRYDIVKLLVDSIPISFEYVSKSLHSSRIFQLLINRITLTVLEQETLLILLLRQNSIQLTRMVLNKYKFNTDFICQAINNSISFNCHEIIMMFLAKKIAKRLSKDKINHLLNLFSGMCKFIPTKFLIEYGADISMINRAIFYVGVANRQKDVVDFLIQRGIKYDHHHTQRILNGEIR